MLEMYSLNVALNSEDRIILHNCSSLTVLFLTEQMFFKSWINFESIHKRNLTLPRKLYIQRINTCSLVWENGPIVSNHHRKNFKCINLKIRNKHSTVNLTAPSITFLNKFSVNNKAELTFADTTTEYKGPFTVIPHVCT